MEASTNKLLEITGPQEHGSDEKAPDGYQDPKVIGGLLTLTFVGPDRKISPCLCRSTKEEQKAKTIDLTLEKSIRLGRQPNFSNTFWASTCGLCQDRVHWSRRLLAKKGVPRQMLWCHIIEQSGSFAASTRHPSVLLRTVSWWLQTLFRDVVC